MGYFSGDNEFHCAASQTVAAPELGFLFPAFDDRTANLYNALFYSRKPDALHQEFIDAVFHTEPPMSAAEQRETFQSALCGALEEDCSMEVVQSVHDYLRQRIQEHKDSRDPEPLAVTAGEVSGVLRNCGVPEARVEAFQAAHGIEELVVVADAGMLSAANLTALDDARLRFIVGARQVRAPGDLKAHFHWAGDAFTDGQLIDTITPRRGSNTERDKSLRAEPVWDPVEYPGSWRAVWAYSKKRAARDTSDPDRPGQPR